MYVRNHPSFDPNYVNIGNSEIIDYRKEFPVKIAGYGNIGDYVPFYFGRQSIMLYNILTGENGIAKHAPTDIVYLCGIIDDLAKSCPRFFFTDGQANKKLTSHFNNLNDLDKVDWATVDGSDFRKSEEDPDKIRRYQAEFLAHQYVPITCINKIVVYNKQKGMNVKQLLKDNNLNIPVKIAMKNNYYFYF